MLRTLTLVLALLCVATSALANPEADAVVGRYWLPDRDGQVEIALRGGRYYGRVIEYDEPAQLDERNPDPMLRTRTFLGIDMFERFRFDAEDDRWVDGTIYDARKGKIYACEMWFEDGDRSVLWARGYIGTPLFGRTESFERVAE